MVLFVFLKGHVGCNMENRFSGGKVGCRETGWEVFYNSLEIDGLGYAHNHSKEGSGLL